MANTYENFTIKVDPADLQAAAETLSQKISQMKNIFSNMISKVDSTANYWQGDASDIYRSTFKEEQPEFDEAFSRMSEHVTDLYNIAGIYTGVEKDATALSGELSSDVIV